MTFGPFPEKDVDSREATVLNGWPMSAKPIPDGYDSLIPSLCVRDASKAIEFYKDVFGATELSRMNYPDSPKIAHAEIKIRNHVLMLGDENAQMGVLAPQAGAAAPPASVMVYVTDVDATFNKAVGKGAKAVMATGNSSTPLVINGVWRRISATFRPKNAPRPWPIGGKSKRRRLKVEQL